MSDDEFVVTQRSTSARRTYEGLIVDVTGYDYRDVVDTRYYVPSKHLGTYAFRKIDDDMADVERGEPPETDGTPVIYVGSGFGKHYWRSHSDTVPADVLKELESRGFQLVRDVGGGWQSWDGRPEFSTSYVDFTDADVVDMAAEIKERGAEQ